MRKFKFSKHPYGADIYKKGTVAISPGITVLIGCNGSGKTTFMNTIRRELIGKDIPIIYYNGDNRRGDVLQDALNRGDASMFAMSAISSEGENIVLSLEHIFDKITDFIKTGEIRGRRNNEFDEVWILFDGVDSGLSIDNIIRLKEVLHKILEENKTGKEIYIILSCNKYEMCIGENCLNVQKMNNIRIKSYNTFRKIIIESRNYKEYANGKFFEDMRRGK